MTSALGNTFLRSARQFLSDTKFCFEQFFIYLGAQSYANVVNSVKLCVVKLVCTSGPPFHHMGIAQTWIWYDVVQSISKQ
jgi:hypothetical protein